MLEAVVRDHDVGDVRLHLRGRLIHLVTTARCVRAGERLVSMPILRPPGSGSSRAPSPQPKSTTVWSARRNRGTSRDRALPLDPRSCAASRRRRGHARRGDANSLLRVHRPILAAVRAARPSSAAQRAHRGAGGRAVVRAADLERVERLERVKASVDDHHYAVADVERRHPVGDDEERQASLEGDQRLLNEPFGRRIERAGRLVEQQEFRFAGERTRKADPLRLPDGNACGARADDRVVALAPAHDVVVDPCESRGTLDRSIVELPEEADVVGDRRVNELRGLRHVCDARRPVRAAQFGGGLGVDEVDPLGRFAQPQEELGERRLPGSRRPMIPIVSPRAASKLISDSTRSPPG